MVKNLVRRWLPIFLVILGVSLGVFGEAKAAEPAIVLTAFGTSTTAFDTYRHIEEKVRVRFPDHDIRWAFTSGKVRRKVAQEQGKQLQDLPATLKQLQAAGISRVAVQSLYIVPGEEWQGVIQQSRQVPGLKVALGKPLLIEEADRQRVLTELVDIFDRFSGK